MEQHPIPQHIASFEFKLFGNLTVRQFITLATPMSVAAAIYFSSLPAIIRLPLSLVVGLFALFAALVPIGGRPADKWVVAFIRAIMSPTQRIWVKESKIPEFLSVVTAPPPTEENIPESITAQGRARLREYLRSLPKGEITPLDVKEQIAVQRLDLGYQEGLPEGQLPPPIIWPTARPFAQASLPQINIVPKLTTAQTPPEEKFPPSAPVQPAGGQPKIPLHAKPFALPGLERKLRQEENPVVELSPTPPLTRREASLIKTKLASDVNAAIESVIPIRTPDRQIKLIHGIGKTRVRKLHFAPPLGFDLSKLPIRGEKRFEISEELKRRYQPAEDLFSSQSTVNSSQFTVHSQTNTQPTGPTPKPSIVNPQPPTELPHAPEPVPKPTKTTSAPQDVFLKKEPLSQIDSRIAIHGQKSKNIPLPGASLPQAQIVPLTHKPNVISGIVTDSAKGPIANVILVVKDANGIPVRAFKTNKLGQFLSATSLSDGIYTIEVESDLQKFEPFTLNLAGQVLSPLEITAKGGDAR